MHLIVAVLLLAQSAERIKWSNTPEAFAGREIEVKLRQGSKVKGSWIGVTPSTFTIHLGKKGPQAFSRADILTIKASKRRVCGRVIGTIAGYIGSVALTAAASGNADNPWAFVAAIGGGTAGYFLGKTFDRDTHIIELLPDDATGAISPLPLNLNRNYVASLHPGSPRTLP